MNETRSSRLRWAIWPAVVLLLFAAVACTTTSASNDSDVDAIRDAYEEYSAALNDGDIERWITLWAEEGRQLPPDTPMRIGRQAIREAVGAALEVVDFEEFAIYPDGVEILGEQGYSHGTYSYELTPKAGGDTISFSGKYLTVFEKQSDGSWKILLDCFNSNGPVE